MEAPQQIIAYGDAADLLVYYSERVELLPAQVASTAKARAGGNWVGRYAPSAAVAMVSQ